MKTQKNSTMRTLAAFLGALALFVCPLLAAPPDLTNGGVPDTIRTNNLGPTGMRGWIYYRNDGGRKADTSESRQILVMSVANGSPAHGVIAKDDVILGVDGTGADPSPFSADARKSFAQAIADAEARNPATLKLLRWNPVTQMTTTVEITLRTMGAYSSTAPYNCAKSAQILAEGTQWVFNHETSGRYRFGAMSLLATGNPAHIAKARDVITTSFPNAAKRTKMMSDDLDLESKVPWERGHFLTLMAEYYLASGNSPATRDATVLPGIEAYAVNIAKNLSLFGTAGHQYADRNKDGSLNGPMAGYGPVNNAGMPCFLGLLLARECGLTNPEIQPAIDRASRFYASYTDLGPIPYGEHNAETSSHENNGKCGLAAVCFALLADRAPAQKFFSQMATASSSEREHGHTGPFFNYLWAPLGAAVAGEAAAAEHFKRISWYLDLNRRWDGAFDYDSLNPEGGEHSGVPYADFRMSTAALLVYALPLRKLHVTGRGHDPTRWLSDAEAADAGAANEYNPTSRTSEQLIADTASWSPKKRVRAAVELTSRGVTTEQRLQFEAIATDNTLPIQTRIGACVALGRIGHIDSATVLAGLLTAPENRIRYASAEALRYFPNTARRSVLNEILAATASTAKPWWPIDEEDPLQLAHGRLANLLFYGGNSWPPQGILISNLNGVDRNLLYPAIRAVAASPLGYTRNTLGWTFPLLTREDMLAVSGSVVDCVNEFPPADRMFAISPRLRGAELFERYSIAEGVPTGLKYAVETRPKERPNALSVIKKYAASATTVTPDPDVIATVTELLSSADGSPAEKEQIRAEAQAVLDAIAANTNPRTITPLKSIQSISADDPHLFLPQQSTTLRVTAFDYAEGDSIFTWKKISGPGEVTFTPNANAAAATSTVDLGGTFGTYQFEVTMSDSRGHTEVSAQVTVIYTAADTLPPMPNRATFANRPTAISTTEITMTATTGSDATGPVEYLFTEVTGRPGGANSVWQTSPTYTNSGLNPNTNYRYTVTMRDQLGNIGIPSVEVGAFTLSDSPVATGGTVTQDGSSFIHTFTQSGADAFQVPNGVTLNADVLIIGGGGSGGSSTSLSLSGSGGGGAGGLIYRAGLPISGNHSIVVGAGGAGPGTGNKSGNNGTNSSFGTLVALGGGGGAGGNTQGKAGGSGGGSRGNTKGGGAQQPDSASGGFGNAGGGWTSSSGHAAGGGGGAGGAATSSPPATATNGGPGGVGLAYDISGTVTHYAGGGGGGAASTSLFGSGGLGGGGDGGNNGTSPTPGAPNTGGGGGGGNNSQVGAAGGSGVVIIRYASSAQSPPTLAPSDIVDDVASGPVILGNSITYTLTFSRDMDINSIDPSDFANAGTATFTLGPISRIASGVFTVEATPTSLGTVQLQIKPDALLTDTANIAMDTATAILDDTEIQIVPLAAGGVVSRVGDYYIHTFTQPGTHTFQVVGGDPLEVDVLVVGGGGGGGASMAFGLAGAGGGGAGGLIYQEGLTISSDTELTVGAGGLAGGGGNVPGSNGGNSSFGALVALGGGGGSGGNMQGLPGGSGGGSRDNANGGAGEQPASTSGGFGNPGGGWTAGGGHGAGGGGGAGGIAATSPPSPATTGGPGGLGLAFDISGTLTHYAGGGGGGGSQSSPFGLGGIGGGGNGGNDGTSPTQGAPNTGGGGGGGNNARAGSRGGSGVVIIRYLAPVTPPPSPYEEWVITHGLTGSQQNPDTILQGDGLTNLQKFAFGMDPKVSSRRVIEFDGNGLITPGMPAFDMPSTNVEDFRAVFTRRKDYLAAGLVYHVHFSAELNEWITSTVVPIIIPSDTDTGLDAVYVPFPASIETADGPKAPKFFRVSVSMN